ncbi:MAG: transcription elongation factor GreA [Candidatus Hepatoplasma vulgare]|nr:MAG: transcription elongation factor GreA [Candidatus Hepatoplasma sp.]
MDFTKNMNIGKTMNDEKIEITKEGILKRKQRLYELINTIRPQILHELSEARKQGDLSENADYDAAKNKQSQIEAEIYELEILLTRAAIIKKGKKNEISIGDIIEYEDLEKKIKKTIKIVSSIEADPTENPPLISIDSPLASSIIGKKTNDKIEIFTPKRKYEIKILKISE